jgi:glycosyltransferase involved in cell wall biosynthesis
MRHTLRSRPHALMGLFFFPRGGSAQVTRSLARVLPPQGWDVTLVSSSLQLPDHPGNAAVFFEGLDIHPLDCSAALAAADPLLATPPLPPSYEDRPGAPDRVFASVDQRTYEHITRVWAQQLGMAGAATATVLHLHHLTPLNAAAARVAPHVPVVGHLHGTELLMLAAIREGPPAQWTYAAAWARRLRAWAASCRRLLVPSASLAPQASDLLGLPPERFLHLPNGFDPERFDRRRVDRGAVWRQALVEHPQGWRPGGAPGSVAYTTEQVAALTDAVVLLYVGRFTALKRLDTLLGAFVRAYPAFQAPAALVLLGGYPGEWEGEHPYDTLARIGAHHVYLAGWREQETLPTFFAAADVVVLASDYEPFGQVVVEGMACGLPVIAVAAGGPKEMVIEGKTGWLVPPQDEAASLVSAVNGEAERRTRGDAAYTDAHARFTWPALGAQLIGIYEDLLGGQTR